MLSAIRRLKIVYIGFDIIALCLSGFISMIIRFEFDYSSIALGWYFIAFGTIVVITIISMYLNGLYDLSIKVFSQQIPRLIQSYLSSMSIFFFWSFFVRHISYSRLTLVYFSLYSIVLLMLCRWIATGIIKNQFKKGIGVKNVLCIGLDNKSSMVINYINEHPEEGLRIRGCLDGSEIAMDGPYLHVLGNINEFNRVIKENKIDILLISVKNKDSIKEIVDYCEQKYIQVFMIPDIIDIMSCPSAVNQINSIPLISIKEVRMTSLQYKVKRLFDILLSSIAIVLLSPVLLILSLIVKLTSEGPVLFTQERLGLNGAVIKVYKFRTMVKDAEGVLKKLFQEQPEIEEEYRKEYKLKDDPRITKIGDFLRKTSLDELPQLFNILRGEMSIVGPRPIQKKEISNYNEFARYILKIPPGLTGMWQVSGRSDINYDERIKLDMYYMNNWSLLMDLMIVLKTIPAVLKKKGAY